MVAAYSHTCQQYADASYSSATLRLKEIRRNMAEALHAEKERKWDLDDYNRASLGVGFM